METNQSDTGTVKVFYPLKGFGFITRKKGRDIFFHYLDIDTNGSDSAVLEGDEVTFFISERNGKPRAIQVRKIG